MIMEVARTICASLKQKFKSWCRLNIAKNVIYVLNLTCCFSITLHLHMVIKIYIFLSYTSATNGIISIPVISSLGIESILLWIKSVSDFVVLSFKLTLSYSSVKMRNILHF